MTRLSGQKKSKKNQKKIEIWPGWVARENRNKVEKNRNWEKNRNCSAGSWGSLRKTQDGSAWSRGSPARNAWVLLRPCGAPLLQELPRLEGLCGICGVVAQEFFKPAAICKIYHKIASKTDCVCSCCVLQSFCPCVLAARRWRSLGFLRRSIGRWLPSMPFFFQSFGCYFAFLLDSIF